MNEAIVELIADAEATAYDFWIGLNDQVSENIFVWDAVNTPLDNDSTSWTPGAPSSGSKGEQNDCVRLDGVTGLWQDTECTETNFFICQELP